MNNRIVNMEAQLLSRMIIAKLLNSGAITTRRTGKHATERQAFGRTLWFFVGLAAIPVVFFVIVFIETLPV